MRWGVARVDMYRVDPLQGVFQSLVHEKVRGKVGTILHGRNTPAGKQSGYPTVVLDNTGGTM